ncbi:MAG: AAA family ATPase [Betaproteobacteria bacterium]|nr:AAA family ATPase [Betaproteobacteria bacterium]
MYLDHFGLNEPPFRITPHTDFFFEGANRGATLDALIYAITHDEGIVKVSGEVGSGKTMLCRVLMERLPDHVTIIYLANPSLSRDDILYAIADELRLDVPENARSSAVMRALQDHLIQSFGEGRQVVVLIDEAHAMPVETLEEIRLLSNLESNRSKLLQLVLFGQPELNDILARPDMRQLKERITHNFDLEPLVREDITQYLDFRMRAAGYRGPSVFSPVALKMIAQSSLGLTRRINILADKALLAAFSSGSHLIGPKEIKAAISDCEFSEAAYGGRAAHKAPVLWIAAAGLLGALVVFVWMTLSRGVADSQATSPNAVATQSGAVAAAPTNPSNKAVTAPTEVPAPPAASVSPTDTPKLPDPTAAPSSPAPAAAPTAMPPASAPVATAKTDSVAAAPSQTPKPRPGRLTLERIEAGRLWLQQASNARWFVQVFDTDASRHAEVETLLRNLSASNMDLAGIHAYYSELSGKPRYGVIYGDFASREAATAAISDLPKQLRANQPYPRQVARLR